MNYLPICTSTCTTSVTSHSNASKDVGVEKDFDGTKSLHDRQKYPYAILWYIKTSYPSVCVMQIYFDLVNTTEPWSAEGQGCCQCRGHFFEFNQRPSPLIFGLVFMSPVLIRATRREHCPVFFSLVVTPFWQLHLTKLHVPKICSFIITLTKCIVALSRKYCDKDAVYLELHFILLRSGYSLWVQLANRRCQLRCTWSHQMF